MKARIMKVRYETLVCTALAILATSTIGTLLNAVYNMQVVA